MGDVGAVATLLSKVLGFAVDPTGYEQLSRENQLKILMRGMNESISKDDWPTCDLLFGQYRELKQRTGP